MFDVLVSSLSALLVLYLSLFLISIGVASMFGGREAMNKVVTQYLSGTLAITRFVLRVALQGIENGARFLRSLL